jgi:hypothetical protein
MQRYRYEIDPYNRLVLTQPGSGSGIPEFRRVLEGRFRIDDNNNLSYNVKSPLSSTESIPNQIMLKGAWSLNDDHTLRLTIDKLARKTLGDQLTLTGQIIDVREDSLLFSVTTRSGVTDEKTYALKLGGAWKADSSNRLSFHVKREGGLYDVLTFAGTWEIGGNNHITYAYERYDLIKKKRQAHTLTFKGYWDINKKGRISYLMGAGTDSSFDFGAEAGIFRNNYIKYQVGIKVSRTYTKTQTVVLTGVWRLKKGLGLVFEAGYGGKIRAISFGADAEITDKDTVTFRLKNGIDNRYIGASLELSHKLITGDGQLFLRALKDSRETAVFVGSAWKW